MSRSEIVWLHEQRTFGLLVRRDAYYSIVRYWDDYFEYEIEVSNDDYDIIFEHEQD
jgi:hypothetical protein